MNRPRSQWVDLGILQEACNTRPETCGAAGGAVAFLMRINHDEGTFHGIISSVIRLPQTTGILIYSYRSTTIDVRYTTTLDLTNHKQ